MEDTIVALLYLLFYEDQQANPMPQERKSALFQSISMLLSSSKGEP